ncbi:MAG: hypothetical protein KBA03_03755 [Anaerolineaceae bacterium]|nr:hypothetical protein [Anaerolineaceae bacterium]
MNEFKNAFDLVNKRAEAVKLLATAIDGLLAEEDGVEQALEQQEALDKAEKDLNDAKELYEKLQNSAMVTESVAALFVPASPDVPQAKDEKKSLSRDEFDAMSAIEQAAFYQNGGRIVEEEK